MNGKQLKNSILQLAIQGKLVPQDPNDEPASELLKRIRKEKEQLVKDGKLKKKDLETAPISDEEKPFEIPETWATCRVKDILLKITDGTHHSPVNTETGDYKYITAKNIKESGISLDNISYVSKEVHDEIFSRCNPSIGDILYIKDGATTGVCCINQLDEDFSMLSSVALLKPSSNLYTPFLLYCLRSPICFDSVRESMKGTGITRITLTKIEQWIIPLPPLSEQHRIVAKIEELMPLVEEYDKAQTKLDDLNAKLPEALKKSILQEAIQGKLVPQDPTDEPASVLLQRIRKEKEQLVKDGKLKKKDLVSEPISDEEKPFEIPESWVWCRMNDILDVRDGTHDSPKYHSVGYPLVTSKNLRNNKIDFSTALLISEEDYISISNRSCVDDEDILYAMIGSIGNPVIVKKDRLFAIKNMALFKKINNGMDMNYAFWYLEFQQDDMRKYASGGVQSFVSLNYLRNYLIPLPPLSEQHRIVAKIEELFTILK